MSQLIIALAEEIGDPKFFTGRSREMAFSVSDDEIAERLYKLEKADLIARGSSTYHYRGLGDPIFAAVFRKHYGPEIENLTPRKIEAEIEQELAVLQG